MHRHLILAVLALSLSAGFAHAADIGAQPPTTMAAADTICARPGVLARIKHRFAYAERTNWHRGYVMETIDDPRPSGHTYAEPGIIKRDYCVADSVMTNGSAHSVYYVVEHGVGFVGIGNSVDFCVLGLDPWYVHDGDCRTVR